jgi:hypothetical protein
MEASIVPRRSKRIRGLAHKYQDNAPHALPSDFNQIKKAEVTSRVDKTTQTEREYVTPEMFRQMLFREDALRLQIKILLERIAVHNAILVQTEKMWMESEAGRNRLQAEILKLI